MSLLPFPYRSLPVLALITAACAGPAGPAGTWVGTVERGGGSARVALRLDPVDDGGLAVRLTLPDQRLADVPLGTARVEDDAVVLGSWSLRYDAAAGTLAGTLPHVLVPVHDIPFELRRGAIPAVEPPLPPAAPRAEPVWTADLGAPIWAGVTFDRGAVYAANDDGRAVALRAATGATLWRFDTAGAVRAAPSVAGDLVIVVSDDGRAYALGRSDGAPRWTASLGETTPGRIPPGEDGSRYDPYAAAAVSDGDTVWIGTRDGRVLALDAATGRERWAFATGGSVLGDAAVDAGRVFAGSFDGKIYALDATSGVIAWSRDTGAPVTSSPAVVGDRLVVGSRSYDFLALSADDGTTLWSHYCWFSWIESSAAVRDGVAYVGSSDAAVLHALDVASGRVRWEYPTGGWTWARPAVGEAAVYVGSVGVAGYGFEHRGGFHAVDRASGRARWRVPVERPADAKLWGFASSPAVGDGLVFVGGLDGRLYAFAE